MAEPEVKKVRCADCGYLTARSMNPVLIGFLEVDSRLRGEGVRTGALENSDYPLCFVRQADLQAKCCKGPDHGDSRKRVLEVINELHDCPEFCAWAQGFTAKEHREMNLIREQREAQQKQKAEDRKWQVTMMRYNIAATVVIGVVGYLAGRAANVVFPLQSSTQQTEKGDTPPTKTRTTEK